MHGMQEVGRDEERPPTHVQIEKLPSGGALIWLFHADPESGLVDWDWSSGDLWAESIEDAKRSIAAWGWVHVDAWEVVDE